MIIPVKYPKWDFIGTCLLILEMPAEIYGFFIQQRKKCQLLLASSVSGVLAASYLSYEAWIESVKAILSSDSRALEGDQRNREKNSRKNGAGAEG